MVLWAFFEMHPIRSHGMWSVVLFYLSIPIVTIIHITTLQSHEAAVSAMTPWRHNERRPTTTVSTLSNKYNNNADDGDGFGMLLALVIYFFGFAGGCLVWAINSQYTHPFQIWQVQLSGSIIMAICTCLFIKVHIDMGNSWYPVPNSRVPQLVTNGMFQYARHPMYAIFVWATIGTLLATLNWVIAWCVSGIVMVTLGRIKTEERILLGLFGESYVEYRGCVSALGIPWQCLGFDDELTTVQQREGGYGTIFKECCQVTCHLIFVWLIQFD